MNDSTAQTLTVALGERSYPVRIGADLLPCAGTEIASVAGSRRLVIITDETVAPLHLGPLMTSLDAAGHRQLGAPITLPPGEATKSMAALEDLLETLLARGIDRKTMLLALGGGVIGDLVGFAAAVALRGIDFIQVPTTLLSQVDSSVGGKTGINSAWGKNLIGAFHQPRLVVADTKALDTLPPRQMRAGYAEIVKYGLIDRPAFFDWLEANGASLLDGDHEARAYAVAQSCAAKAAIVAADEREAGQRALLNLGHTFAHALELASGYGDRLLHGEAVAIGMAMAFDLSVKLGLCPPNDAHRVRRHLSSAGLPVVPPAGVDPDLMVDYMRKDKKAEGGALTLVLAHGVGKAFVARDVDASEIRGVWQQASAA